MGNFYAQCNIREHGLPQFTQRLITDTQDYLAEPGLARRQEYAVDEEEGLPGGGCLW